MFPLLIQTPQGVLLLVGLRSGKIVRYRLDGAAADHAITATPQDAHALFPSTSKGAVYHLVFTHASEFLAVYTNGEVGRGSELTLDRAWRRVAME